MVSSCYTLIWDLRMDWGLFDRNAGENSFLREEIVYPHKVPPPPDFLERNCLVMIRWCRLFLSLVSSLPGVLLQCHCGRRPPALCMDFNHFCHHSHRHTLQFWHTGYSPGSTWGVQVQKKAITHFFCLVMIQHLQTDPKTKVRRGAHSWCLSSTDALCGIFSDLRTNIWITAASSEPSETSAWLRSMPMTRLCWSRWWTKRTVSGTDTARRPGKGATAWIYAGRDSRHSECWLS